MCLFHSEDAVLLSKYLMHSQFPPFPLAASDPLQGVFFQVISG